MKKNLLIFALIIFPFLAGCRTVVLPTKPPLAEEGEIYIYMEPFPPGGERLKFSLAGLLAVREDERQFPLTLARTEMTPETMNRQHFLASGMLPPGRYVGLAFAVQEAALKSEEGYYRLLAEAVPVRNNFPFEITKKKALTISITLKPTNSFQEGFRFTPSFSLSIPSKPLVTLTGYVTNTRDNTVTVFDKKTGRIGGMIATGEGPAGLAIDQARRHAYVALAAEDAVAVIDMAAGEIVNRISLQALDAPWEIALAPDGRTLLTVNRGSNTVSVVDPLFLNEIMRITVGNRPVAIAVDRNGQRAYVFNSFSNSLSVIDIPGRTIAATVATEPAPLWGEFNSKGDKLYIAHEWSPYLTVLDTATLTVVQRAYVGPGVAYLKLDARTDILYVRRKNSATVEGLNPLSLLPVSYLTARGEAEHITIDNETGTFFLVVPERQVITAINPTGKDTIFEIDTGREPYRAALLGER